MVLIDLQENIFFFFNMKNLKKDFFEFFRSEKWKFSENKDKILPLFRFNLIYLVVKIENGKMFYSFSGKTMLCKNYCLLINGNETFNLAQ